VFQFHSGRLSGGFPMRKRCHGRVWRETDADTPERERSSPISSNANTATLSHRCAWSRASENVGRIEAIFREVRIAGTDNPALRKVVRTQDVYSGRASVELDHLIWEITKPTLGNSTLKRGHWDNRNCHCGAKAQRHYLATRSSTQRSAAAL
jgi:hypothetical protein